jgi:bacteriophage exclusion system BrxA-like protein
MLPVLHRSLGGEAPYTTQLGAGLGLIAETVRLLDLWESGMSAQGLLRLALESGAFATISARRLRNIIIEAFAPRYLVDGAQPARLLKILQGQIPQLDLRQILFLYTSRANPILADFIQEVYWQRYGAGAQAVTKNDARIFIRGAVGRGRATTRWAESTIIRVSNYLLGICADYGLLGTMRADARAIIPFRMTPVTTSVLAHELHFRGLGDSAVVHHSEWGLFGLEPADVLQELKRLALRGEIIVQSAAAVTQIGWKHKSVEELAHVLAAS